MKSSSMSVIVHCMLSKEVTVPDQIHSLLDNCSSAILKVGAMETEVKCCRNGTKNRVEIPANLADTLGLSEGMMTNLTIKNSKLCLGPVLGVFVSAGQIRKANLQNPHFRLTELMKANIEAKTILYYFSVRDVDFEKQRINGTYYNKKTCNWTKRCFPYPDVLYDRGGGVLRSQALQSARIRRQLQANGELKKINPLYYFDKWDVYQQLVKNRSMLSYLPHTVLYRSAKDLHTMLQLHAAIYIKECRSNNGKGVFRARKLPFGMFELVYYRKKLVTSVYGSFVQLVKNLNALLEDRKIILQAAIDVMKVNNCNVDFRALVQRDGNGTMEIGVSPARIGKIGYPVTNTNSGASVYHFEDFLRSHLHSMDERSQEDLRRRIENFLSTCFTAVEEAFGTFGEMGIDFALDTNLNVWFIECNAKPGKDALYRVYDQEHVKRAFLNPLQYGKYISDF